MTYSRPPSSKLTILYEDNHLIAVDKPVGVPSQSDISKVVDLRSIVMEDIRVRYDKPGNVFTGLIHRLDRPTSGVILFAKTQKALSRMSMQFRDKEVRKLYLCLSAKCPEPASAHLRHYLFKDSRKNKSFVTSKTGRSKEAILDYRLLGQVQHRYLSEIVPATGRSHQIRVQMAHIGCPLAGDRKYGGEKIHDSSVFGLHAYQLSFLHPVRREPLTITCGPPDNHLWQGSKTLL